VGSGGEVVRAGYAARHSLALARLERAGEAGELRGDVDPSILIDQLAGPIYYRILITGAPADRGYAERLVNAVPDGAMTGHAMTDGASTAKEIQT
jgi:hypothetical protein